jgi:hypothetical protein
LCRAESPQRKVAYIWREAKMEGRSRVEGRQPHPECRVAPGAWWCPEQGSHRADLWVGHLILESYL